MSSCVLSHLIFLLTTFSSTTEGTISDDHVYFLVELTNCVVDL